MFENPKPLQQTTFKALKYLQKIMFLIACFRQKYDEFSKAQSCQNMFSFIWSNSSIHKNHKELPQTAQLAKIAQSGHPGYAVLK